MKQLKNIFRIHCLLFLCFWLGGITPVKAQYTPNPMDSVEIGLITCSPHDEVYSLYGHSAIHYRDLRNDVDYVFNYGVFDYNKPYFVLRFIFGKTDYELGVCSFNAFCKEYERWKCQVSEQVLDLTPEEKDRIIKALFLNAQPENCVYRYNIFYNNCTSNARDIIEKHLDGSITYEGQPAQRGDTYRKLLHEHTADNPWAAFGSDLLIGVKADFKIDQREQQFLPRNLAYDFNRAFVVRNGEKRPLVKETIIWNPLGDQPVSTGFPLSPLVCFIILLIISLGVFVYEQRKKTCLRWFDVTLMLLTGLAGCIVFVMFFSEHPATSTNLQILILNPLSLFFIPQVFRGKKTRWFVISLCATILFLIGGLWQDYAEGMYILALCLLLRYWRHRHEK